MPERWSNWAGDQTCAPERIERPDSEEALAAAVRRATDQGQRVRMAGSGHSFTDAACTDAVMVDIAGMRRVLDVEGPHVTVEAGITLHRLGRELAARGLAMESQGDIDRQTLAGAIATATHGTGTGFRNLSSQVTGLRLVSAKGEVLELSPEEEGEALLAARVGLGCLGAISAVTLRCVPLFTIRRLDEPRALEETLARFDMLADGHDHFEFYVFPYSDVAIVRLSERGHFPPAPVGRARLYVEEVLVENRVVDGAARLCRRFPALVPSLNRSFARLVGRRVRTDLSFRIYASRRELRFTEMEYAVPREHCVEAVRRVLETVERRGLAVPLPVEVRVAAADDAFLSTAHGRDTAYVAVHRYRGMEHEGYFRAVERIMDDYGGRPHWGKLHYQTAASLRERYPDWDRFQAVRARLDPEGRFENDYSERVLGALRTPSALTSA